MNKGTTTYWHTGISKIKVGKICMLASTFAMAIFTSQSTMAALTSNGNCNISGVNTFTVNRINKSADSSYNDGAQVWTAPQQGISGNYTQCKGFYDGNDTGTSLPNENIGWRNDGLLNQSIFDDLLSSGQTTQDIPGNTATDDPGWIRLAEANDGNIIYEGLDFGSTQINLADYIQFSMDFGESGTWSLKISTDLVALGQQLGLDTFDHLAFIVKQGNSSKHGPGGFAVYDFDFQEFIDQNILDQSTAYNFYGTFDLDGIHGEGFSHVSLWARDPSTSSNSVPVPATLALFGLGLVCLGWAKRNKA